MTKEQAIKEMKEWTDVWCKAYGDIEFRPCIECARDCAIKDVLKIAIECIEKQIAIECIEKQIAKKPLDFGDEAYLCPTCKRNNFYEGTEYLHKQKRCSVCDQAIDWSAFE